MPVTARQIIRKALQKNGVLVMGETPSADEASDGLDSLNSMLASWSNDSITIVSRVWETFNLVSGQAAYTIGTGANFNTERPIFIAEAYVRQNTLDTPLAIISDESYNNWIQQKNIGGIPEALNYDNAYPVGKIRLWPVPSSALQLFILSEKQITQFALDDQVNLPPGWQDAIIYNLAIRLAPEYGQPVSPELQKIANETKGAISRAILKARTIDTPPLMTKAGFNIYSGWYQ